MMAGHCMGTAAVPTIELLVSTDTADYNVFTAAGSPSGAINIICTVSTGINVHQSAGISGLRTGALPAGSSLKLIVHGLIGGSRGTKGLGGTTSHHAGFDGVDGGDAVAIECDGVSIDVTDGSIFGGGGGAGGGAWANNGISDFDGGDGGAGQDYNHAKSNGQHVTPPGGDGGNGGTWGTNGQNGTSTTGIVHVTGAAGGSKGRAGKAVALNGHAVTWLGGFDTTHVKGAVS